MDFRIGDEVVCVDAGPCDPSEVNGFGRDLGLPISKGGIYTVTGFGVWPGDGVTPVIFLNEVSNDDGVEDVGFLPRRFRKVQRRDLSAWLETAATDTDHLDKPIKTPARPKVDALLKRVQSGAFG